MARLSAPSEDTGRQSPSVTLLMDPSSGASSGAPGELLVWLLVFPILLFGGLREASRVLPGEVSVPASSPLSASPWQCPLRLRFAYLPPGTPSLCHTGMPPHTLPPGLFSCLTFGAAFSGCHLSSMPVPGRDVQGCDASRSRLMLASVQ